MGRRTGQAGRLSIGACAAGQTGTAHPGRIRISSDKKSGKNAEREELWKALDYLRPGDTLVVPSLDRLDRSLQDLISIVAGLRERGS